jgi:DNA-binding YbaB/EbfC family protein
VLKGLGNLANLGALVKQAQQMGAQMEQLAEEVKRRRATGTAAGGMVSVEVSGAGEVLCCRIEPAVFAQGDRELIEEMIPTAVNQALGKAKQMHAEALQSIGESPGLADMLSRLSGGGGLGSVS